MGTFPPEEESIEGSTEGYTGNKWEWLRGWGDGHCRAGMSFVDREGEHDTCEQGKEDDCGWEDLSEVRSHLRWGRRNGRGPGWGCL